MWSRMGGTTAVLWSLFVAAYFQQLPATADRAAAVDSDSCVDLARHFITEHGKHPSSTPNAAESLYFLHVPRTAGRTYNFCFLRLAHPPSKRCPKSYDTLRVHDTKVGCGLLSSHDDFSAIDMLPDNAAVVTQLREPVDRLLSSFEFGVEVASRALGDKRKRNRDPAHPKVETTQVWPWSYVVPLLEERILIQAPKAIKEAEANPRPDEVLDPYDNDLMMSLREYVDHPEVEELIHNGATLQVLGLTNYSSWASAAALRRCLPGSQAAQKLLLDLAIERLETFVHVGLFDRLDESVASLAASLNTDLDGKSWQTKGLESNQTKREDLDEVRQKLKTAESHVKQGFSHLQSAQKAAQKAANDPDADAAIIAKTEGNVMKLKRRQAELEHEASLLRSFLDPKSAAFEWQSHWDEAYESEYPLWRAYHQCVDYTRKKNSDRRDNSYRHLDLPDGRKFGFTREGRANLDPSLLALIKSKNQMDISLYEAAKKLFEKRLKEHKDKAELQSVRTAAEADVPAMKQRERDLFPQSGTSGRMNVDQPQRPGMQRPGLGQKGMGRRRPYREEPHTEELR